MNPIMLDGAGHRAISELISAVVTSGQNFGKPMLEKAQAASKALTTALLRSENEGTHSIFGRMLHALACARRCAPSGSFEFRLGPLQMNEWHKACEDRSAGARPDGETSSEKFLGVPVKCEQEQDGVHCVLRISRIG